MAQRITNTVCGVFHVAGPPGGPEIANGSPSQAAGLRYLVSSSFSFRGTSGTFTARRGHRVDGTYWTAYRKRDGRFRRTYLGEAEKPSLKKAQGCRRSAGQKRWRYAGEPGSGCEYQRR